MKVISIRKKKKAVRSHESFRAQVRFSDRRLLQANLRNDAQAITSKKWKGYFTILQKPEADFTESIFP